MTAGLSFLMLTVHILSIKNAVLRSEHPSLRIEYTELGDGDADEQSILDHG